jgi:signal transduction histidine kinase
MQRIEGPTREAIKPVDVIVAVGLASLSMVAFVGGAPDVGTPGALTVALLLLQSLPLIARRPFPLEVMLVVVTATIVQIALVPPGGAIQAGLGVLVAIYTIGERLERRMSLALTLLTGVILAILIIAKGGLPGALQGLIQTELILGVAWLLGDASRIRRLYTETLEAQATLVERERDERTRRAILEERERISRELHDVVTHHVSVMVIQAGGGARAIDKRPDDARSAFEAIAATGRQALADMRRMLGILGEGGAAEPMPGLDRLDDLLEHVRTAGLEVSVSVTGDPRRLDPGLELTAYRIIQEGLTNSLKHAGGRARLAIAYAPRALEITVDDDRGPDPAPPVESGHEGRGLVGMRERVAMFRGTFAAEPTATGFRVTAELPIDDSVGVP